MGGWAGGDLMMARAERLGDGRAWVGMAQRERGVGGGRAWVGRAGGKGLAGGRGERAWVALRAQGCAGRSVEVRSSTAQREEEQQQSWYPREPAPGQAGRASDFW